MEVISQSEYVTIGELVRLTGRAVQHLKFYTEQGCCPLSRPSRT